MTTEEQWAGLVATGYAKCSRCAEYIGVEEPWVLVEDRHGYLRPVHEVGCKRG